MPTPSVNPRDHLVQYGVVKKSKLKALYASLLFVLQVFYNLLLPTSIVYAQDTPDPDLFYGQGSCNEMSPDTCDCLYAFRDKDTGETAFYQGLQSRDDKKIKDAGILLNNERNLEFSVFVYAPDSDTPSHCYWEHQESNSKANWERGLTNGLEGCGIGLVTAIATPFTAFGGCIIGGGGGFLTTINLQDLATNITEGYWDSHYKTGDNCNWMEGNIQIANWEDYHPFENKAVRLDRNGEWGSVPILGRLQEDDQYCTILTLPIDPDLFVNKNAIGESDNSTESYNLCKQVPDGAGKENCMDCADKNGIWTAVGCIPTDEVSIIQTFITIGLNVGGGVVIIMILIGGFMLSISQGDVKRTGEAKEMITSAIIGLLFIIFSVTILQFIGVSVLNIPGFGSV